MGTSTTTTYIESASGIAEGKKRSLCGSDCPAFLVALFFSPIIGIVPGFATAPALVVVGVFMLKISGILIFQTSAWLFRVFNCGFDALNLQHQYWTHFDFSYLIIEIASGEIKNQSGNVDYRHSSAIDLSVQAVLFLK